MKVIRGIYRDTTEQDIPEGFSSFIKNFILTDIKGAARNEPGFTMYNNQVPYLIIGGIGIDDDIVIFSTNNIACDDLGVSEIGIIKAGVYTKIINSVDIPGLNFCTLAPIDAEYNLIGNGDRVVAFIDDNNVPRLINIDDISGIDDINDLSIFPNSQIPIVDSVTVLDAGGNLLVGGYYGVFKYKNNDGTETSWFNTHGPIYINEDSITEGFDQYDGSAPGLRSSKAISFQLSNLDLNYDSIVLGIIHSNGGVLVASEVREVNLTSNLTILYTGSETVTSIALEEVLVGSPSYINAKAVGVLNNALYLGNMTAETDISLQDVANDILVDYTINLVDATQLATSHKSNIPAGYQPGEVYCFYLHGVRKDGSLTQGFHIPGRPSISSDLDVIAADPATGLSQYVRYQVEYTANNGLSGAVTNMGYWENSNEAYPDDLQDDNVTRVFPTGNVRHHRFPEFGEFGFRENFGGGLIPPGDLPEVGINKFPIFGIDVSNINIPVELQDQLQGWTISYAKKDIANSLVLGHDLLYYSAYSLEDLNARWGTAGNWNLNAERPGGATKPNMFIVQSEYLRGHCLDLMSAKPAVAPNYILVDTILTVDESVLNTQYSGFRQNTGLLSKAGDGFDQSAGAVSDYTVAAGVTKTFIAGNRCAISNFEYLPSGVIADKVRTDHTEPIISCSIDGTSLPSITINTFNTMSPGEGAFTPQIDGSETVLRFHYMNFLTDVHVSFLNQTLALTDKVINNIAQTSQAGIFGGDTFVSYQSFLLAGPVGGSLIGQNPLDGLRCPKGFIGYSKRNWNLRHQDDTDIYTNYHPKKDPNDYWFPDEFGIGQIDTSKQLNQILYNSDFNLTNDLVALTVFNPKNKLTNQFPNLIVKSANQDEESGELLWKVFRANDRYTTEQAKGEIVNLQGIANEHLLIHQKDGLFITRDRTTITGDGTSITLSAGNIFSLNPKELLSTDEGFAGTQHRYSCKLTKAGYVFTDLKRGKVFLLQGVSDLKEISGLGLRNFFRDNLPSNLQDNPFTIEGVTVGYDETYNRVLFSFVNGDKSFTISFSPELNAWASWHDYTPNFILAARDNTLYSVNNGFGDKQVVDINRKGIFKHNDIINGHPGIFYNVVDAVPIPYTSIVDCVDNSGDYESKLYTGVEWTTEVRGSVDGVFYELETFTSVWARGNLRATKVTTLKNNTNINDFVINTVRNTESTWHFNDFRDVALEGIPLTLEYEDNYDPNPAALELNRGWFDKGHFIAKFVVTRFVYDNVLNRQILLLDCKANYRKSIR